MSYTHPDMSEVAIQNAEHIDPATSGDNIAAKKTAGYQWDGSNWQRNPINFVDRPYDYTAFSNPDGAGNYQTIVFKIGGSGGTTQRTLTLAFDGNSNITSIART
jgi:hypothetical protein